MRSLSSAPAADAPRSRGPGPRTGDSFRFPSRTALGSRHWLLFNLKMGFITFGTGSVPPLYRRMLVEETRALTEEQFQEALTIAQMLPGPSLVSLSMYIGDRLFGPRASALAAFALCLPGSLWAVLALHFIPIGHAGVRLLLAGCSVAAAVMILDLGWRLRAGLASTPIEGVAASRAAHAGRWACAGLVAAMSQSHLPLGAVVAMGAVAGLVVEFAT